MLVSAESVLSASEKDTSALSDCMFMRDAPQTIETILTAVAAARGVRMSLSGRKTLAEILAEEGTVDLGNGSCYQKCCDRDGNWVAIYEFHENSGGDLCYGWVPFNMESEYINSNTPRWDVLSYEPLTLSPSLLCNCGHHGFIRNGRWESC